MPNVYTEYALKVLIKQFFPQMMYMISKINLYSRHAYYGILVENERKR